MREIKFRAWDKQNKTMHNWSEISIEENQVFITDGDLYKTFEQVDIMQYTGLKDKNGKEIYEGDIVLIEHIAYSSIAQYESKLQESFRIIGKYVCKYDDGSFKFSNGLNSLLISDFWRWNQEKEFYYATGDTVRERDRFGYESKDIFRFIELAGNVYENPELLQND